MKKVILTILSILYSIPTYSQTAEELTKELQKLTLENQMLTAQENGYKTKITQKEKEVKDTQQKLDSLQNKRNNSASVCKAISDENVQIIQGLSAGTIAISATGTLAGAVNITDTALQNKGGIVGSIQTAFQKNKTNETEKENTDTLNNKETSSRGDGKPSIIQKVTNIASTATSVGSTITSAIALSKVDELKNQAKKCLDSFN